MNKQVFFLFHGNKIEVFRQREVTCVGGNLAPRAVELFIRPL